MIIMKATTKKRLAVTAIVLAALAVIYLILVLLPKPHNTKGENGMMKEGDLPLLIAHGGGNKEFPDNTLEAFYNAYDADPRVMMETDVSITKDGVVILSHDVTIDRKTNRSGRIEDWNYTDLIAEKVDFSYHNSTNDDQEFDGTERVKYQNGAGVAVKPTDVPGYPEGLPGRDAEVFLATTLRELLTCFPENRVNVEIKQSGETGKRALTAILALLDELDAYDRVVLASFHDEIYAEFKTVQKDNPAFLYSPAIGGVVKYVILKTVGLDVFFTDGISVFQIPMKEAGINLATESLVKNAHKHNIAVHYWTIDDVEDMKYLIEIGADGIMTNYPHRLKDVYEAYRGES